MNKRAIFLALLAVLLLLAACGPAAVDTVAEEVVEAGDDDGSFLVYASPL